MLGLGHLGNAYLWALGDAALREAKVKARFFLNDFDSVEDENIETGLLFSPRGPEIVPSRGPVPHGWNGRGFRDPFARTPIRRSIFAVSAVNQGSRYADSILTLHVASWTRQKFARVIESGLGGTSNNFDTIEPPRTTESPALRSMISGRISLRGRREEARGPPRDRFAQENEAYARSGLDACGRFEFAGKSIAVPFVGAVAGCLRRRGDAPLVPRRSSLYRHQAAPGDSDEGLRTAAWPLRSRRYVGPQIHGGAAAVEHSFDRTMSGAADLGRGQCRRTFGE